MSANENLAVAPTANNPIAANTKTASELIKEFITLRDAKAVATKRVSEYMASTFNDRMFEIQVILEDMINKTGGDSIKDNDVGIAFKSISRSITHADKKAFRDYVLEHGAWHLVDWTAAKTAVVEAMEQGEPLPPGLNYSSEYTINIRKA